MAFRHELARRAVEQSLPVTVRFALNARVTAALLARPTPDLARVLHHAVEAGDDAAVVRHGPDAAREASRAGAHRQAVAAYEQVLGARGPARPGRARGAARRPRLEPLQRQPAARRRRGGRRGRGRCAERLGDRSALVTSLVTLSRQQWLLRRTADALRRARGGRTTSPAGSGPAARRPGSTWAAVLVLVDREEEGLPHLDRASTPPTDPELAVLARNYHGSALLQLGDLAGSAELLESVAAARDLGQHEYVMRGYYNLAEGLWRLGRYAERRAVPRRRPPSTAATATSRPTPTSSRPAGSGCC